MKMSVLIKLERLSLLSVILSSLFFSSYSAFADNIDLDDRDLKTLSKLDLLDAKQVAGMPIKLDWLPLLTAQEYLLSSALY